MITLKLRDCNFLHNKTGTTTPFFTSPQITWDRSINDTDITVYTDHCLPLIDEMASSDVKAVAWLLEPEVIYPQSYQYIKSNFHKFHAVATHDKTLSRVIPNAHYVPYGTSWIPKEHWGGSVKTKWMSLIASSKKATTGHRMRHRAAEAFKGAIDLFGSGYASIDLKTPALAPYKYSIVAENCRSYGYFTEKLIDCFATKTIPIYWGSPEIGEWFDDEGIIKFDTIGDLTVILKDIANEGFYDSRKEAIENNLRVATEYTTAENRLYNLIEAIYEDKKPIVSINSIP